MKYISDNYGSIDVATSFICEGAKSRGAQEVSTSTDENFDNFYGDVWFGSVETEVSFPKNDLICQKIKTYASKFPKIFF